MFLIYDSLKLSVQDYYTKLEYITSNYDHYDTYKYDFAYMIFYIAMNISDMDDRTSIDGLLPDNYKLTDLINHIILNNIIKKTENVKEQTTSNIIKCDELSLQTAQFIFDKELSKYLESNSIDYIDNDLLQFLKSNKKTNIYFEKYSELTKKLLKNIKLWGTFESINTSDDFNDYLIFNYFYFFLYKKLLDDNDCSSIMSSNIPTILKYKIISILFFNLIKNAKITNKYILSIDL